MPPTSEGPTQRASRWETLGAWLHVWTPRRNIYVPPPPSPRRVVRWALAAGIPLAVALAVAGVLIAQGKDEGAARERRHAAAIHARELARVRAEQVPRHDRGRAHAAPAALVGDLERAITADARQRVRQHKLEGPIAATTCNSYDPGVTDPPRLPPPGTKVGKFECIASSASLAFGTQRVTTGYPFWARVDFRTSRLVWCKINLQAGEGVATGRPNDAVPLAPACDLTRG